MKSCRQSTSRTPPQLFIVASDAGSMLVHAHNGRVDHAHGRCQYLFTSALGAWPTRRDIWTPSTRAKMIRERGRHLMLHWQSRFWPDAGYGLNGNCGPDGLPKLC